ncbi:plant UBX domain-containing protein 10-like [Bidens hawaiensis]|uniref:plant UBX domain-containing protein 10-like n=1 Tax=Bidens hawaiensis TaxID=980011 RepID=UPI0040490E4B
MSNPLDILETSCTRLVRRVVNLPRTISRVVDQGLAVVNHRFPPPNVPLRNHHQSIPNNLQPNWDFLAGFEQQFGVTHPFFYACRFEEVLNMAQNEHKFVFLYLHSPDHPFTPPFCKGTLCSEVVVEFLDANFMSWGGVASSVEGLHLAATIRPTMFPYCAIVACGSDGSLVVVQKLEGPVTPEELLETLQTTLEEQGLVPDSRMARKEEKRRDDIRLRQEQDAAYSASLQADQEKVLKSKKKAQRQENASQNNQDIQVLIRFPNGERKQRVFSRRDKIEAIFKYIDSLGQLDVGRKYRLVSSFPRKAYGVDQMRMSLKDAEFDQEATLFIELV